MNTTTLMPNIAALHLERPDWNGVLPFFILRAAHYLEEFHGMAELTLDCAEVPAAVQTLWDNSLGLMKRKISIRCGVTPKPEHQVFRAPDFLMYTPSGSLSLGIPEFPDLTDFHLHTRLAYCSENMDVAAALQMERLSGVSHVNFAEHSGQLYAPGEIYWSNRFLWKDRLPFADRTPQYEELIRRSPAALYGLELDVDADAAVADFRSPLLNGYRIGAVHFLGKDLDFAGKKADFLRRLDALLSGGIDILAHPFRVFRKGGLPVPEDLFRPVAERLTAAKVAAEINFHTNRPHPEFVELLLKKGGMISFGTDSHNLYEAGYLRPHYEFCRELGIAGRLDEILFRHTSERTDVSKSKR